MQENKLISFEEEIEKKEQEYFIASFVFAIIYYSIWAGIFFAKDEWILALATIGLILFFSGELIKLLGNDKRFIHRIRNLLRLWKT